MIKILSENKRIIDITGRLVLQRYNCSGDHNKNKARSFGYQSRLRNPDSSIL